MKRLFLLVAMLGVALALSGCDLLASEETGGMTTSEAGGIIRSVFNPATSQINAVMGGSPIPAGISFSASGTSNHSIDFDTTTTSSMTSSGETTFSGTIKVDGLAFSHSELSTYMN
jgi:hypothetical protein